MVRVARDDDSRLDNRLRSTLGNAGIPGAVVSVIVDSGDVATRGIGHRDVARQQPMTGDERFYIYSATKPLIATAVLHLVERGHVELDQPVSTCLPDLPGLLEDERITVRRLLNHTAGLPDYGLLPEYGAEVRATPGQPWTHREFLDRTLARGLEYEPGNGWAYSNIGFMLLKLLVERVHDGNLNTVLRSEVFEPLGLHHPIVATSLADTIHLSPGFSAYLSSDGQMEDIRQTYHPGWVSHGVVIARAGDLARMIDEIVHVGGALLTERSREVLLAPVILPFKHPGFVQPAYGLGVMIDAATPFGVVAGHGGGGPGYSTGAFHFSNVNGHAITIVAITNSDRSDPGMQLVTEMFDLTREYLTAS